ncbi:hypothetical protein MUK42_23197 [Musa troglodytarum]|uniref:Uncharacterized protein n=1 Tax=Musa troglodytarum TaxID=320322 RepID=A0A9E7GAE0_9LILI|nr:hypothetical protein MUK42_23197 [Musa troglodytarum]
MIAHRQRREFSTGDQFSFANPTHGASDGQTMERATVAAGTKAKLGPWTRRASLNLPGYGKRDGDEDFRWLPKEDGDDSGTPSPPLWKNVGLPAARSADSSPAHMHHHGTQAFPTSRAEEIARYRQEMLDLVRDMPEPAYELSLRDMVEAPRVAKTVQEMIEKRRTEAKDQGKEKRRLLRKESMETGGVFLKMFVPISMRGGRRKSFGGSNTCSKVSPRPVSAEAEKAGLEVTEGEWWEKELGGRGSSSNSSSSSKSSSGSSRSSTSRSGSRKMNGCYPFFLTNKSRSKEI